jgi:hypothetical protein
MKIKGEESGKWPVRNGEKGRRQTHHTPRCVCVNAVDKGVSERFGVKAVDKGLTARVGVPLGLARGKKAVDTGLMAPGDCGDKFSGGEKEGLDGDTVQQNLVLRLPQPLLT